MAYRVIDVSEWQCSIDWQGVADSGVNGVIVRAGWGEIKNPSGGDWDSCADANIRGAKAVGLHLGLYVYSYASTEYEAIKEADFIKSVVDCYPPTTFDMPFYIDLEEASLADAARMVADAYLKHCDELGIKGGVYANLNWFTNYIGTTGLENRPLWIAHYSHTEDYSGSVYGMWQYTSAGSIQGINGHCDLNDCYVKYWGDESVKPIEPQTQTHLWDIWAIQYWMVICNYNPFAPIDGLDGEQTEIGVKTGQRGYGVEADGKFGLITQKRAAGQILAYQTKLKELGFYTGELDGIPGRLTFQGIMDFQESRNLAVDGIVGEQTFNALMGSAPRPTPPDFSDETVLSNNFKRGEFKCECGVLGLHYCNGYPVEPHPVLVKVLQRLSDEIGKPIFITSGIRCQTYNDSLVGSVPNSIHLSGGAADFTFDGIDTWGIVEWCSAQPEVTYSYTNDSYMYGAVHIQVE